MDFNAPNSEPEKSFEKPNTEKAEKNDIASKPDDTQKKSKADYKDKKNEGSSQKPKDKPKNKIEPRKIDPKKEPKHKIQPRKSNPLTPPRNKIAPRKIDIQKEPRHKIQRQKSNPLTPPRNKIEPRKLDASQVTKNKIVLPKIESKDKQNFETNKHNIEYTPSKENIKNDTFNRLEKKVNNFKFQKENNQKLAIKPKNPQIPPSNLNKKVELVNLEPKNKIEHIPIKESKSIVKPKLNYTSKNKLFNDGKQKECGRCHQIKLHNEFELRIDKRKTKPYLRSNCNQCKNELKQIYLFRNKYKILTNIYNGKYKERCPECETKFIKLPTFDFHHPDRSLKEEQRIRTYGNWTKTMEKLEKEKVIPLCKNCHSIKQATTYNKYKEIILKRNDFEKKLEGMEKNIHQYMRTNLKYQKYEEIRQIKPWIKKRIVIERLYNGKCVGCDEDKLPTLQFHHKDPKQKTYEKWSDLSNLNIREIMKKLKNDNAVCLCANCHGMTESSQFKENINKIIEKRDIPELKTYYKKINQNIKKYVFPNQPEPPHKNFRKQESTKLPEKTHIQKRLSSANLQLASKKENEQEVAKKPDNKLKPKNKIERPKIDIQKGSRNKIQREKIDLHTPARNKIERPKFNPNNEAINKIQPYKPKLEILKTKIEQIPTDEPRISVKLEGNKLTLDQIKQEIKKINWKSVTENWTVKVSAKKEITLNPYTLPSKENPLYKHKEWLQTVYNHKIWNLNDNMLRKISGVSNSTIYSWRQKFNIPTKQSNQKPFKDETHKECGRCHQIKPQSEFKVRNDKRKDKPYSRSNCSKCKNELNQIYIFKNKLRILTNICKGYDKIRCSECETRVNRLPAFDFHHPDNNLKKVERIRMNLNWNKSKEMLEKEKTIPLCKNCHAVKKTTVYNKFKEVILKKNNFENNLEGIENNIHQYVKTNFNSDNPKSQLIQIKSWIKKRIVIEKLFNGKCIGCGEEKLPSLQFHHKNPEKKTYRSWSDINNLNISEIIKKFKEDTAICLCANCHSMAESRHFKENVGEILENKDLHEVRTFYKKLNQKINNYSFPNQPEKQKTSKLHVKSHNQKILSGSEIQSSNRKEIGPRPNLSGKHGNESLKYQYGYGEAWKKYLTHINKLLSEGKEVQTKILAQSVGVNTRNTRKNIQKLIAK